MGRAAVSQTPSQRVPVMPAECRCLVSAAGGCLVMVGKWRLQSEADAQVVEDRIWSVHTEEAEKRGLLNTSINIIAHLCPLEKC